MKSPPATTSRARLALVALTIAAVAGAVHAAFSLYWGFGGTWLVSTLGDRVVTAFADAHWMLFATGVIKLGVAVAPLLLVIRGRPIPRLARLVCWLAAVVLIMWGGMNTVIGNLVLTGVVEPAGGYDRAGMIGHAWLWDPLFLIWGGALAIGLIITRQPR